MKWGNLVLLVAGIFCVAVSGWQITAAQKGLEVITLQTTDTPVTIITPRDVAPATRPTVLIAHGFAGSSVLMRGFALTLAHAGYTTVSWDFQGMGTNPNPLNLSSETNQLLNDVESALAEAETTGLIDPQRIAILGHSMGSGIALAYSLSHPDTSATIAISAGGQPVTPSLPHNLLLMVGKLDAMFLSSTEQLLTLAGGPNSDFTAGTARQLVILPNLEHISILFSPTAQNIARIWLDETFGQQPGASTYTDRRLIWYGLGILGFIFLSNAGLQMSLSSSQARAKPHPVWLQLVALFGGGISATIVLWLISLAGVNLTRIFGLLVGGYMILWFGVAGMISLIILRPRIPRLSRIELIKGVLAFLALWLGVGLIGNYVWLPWLLIPARLWLWIPSSIIVFPWFIVIGELIKDGRLPGQVGWWIFQSTTIIVSLLLATRLTPGLGFLFIILPLVPVVIGLHRLVISSRHGSWAYALSGAMFIAWLLLAVFPLQ